MVRFTTLIFVLVPVRVRLLAALQHAESTRITDMEEKAGEHRKQKGDEYEDVEEEEDGSQVPSSDQYSIQNSSFTPPAHLPPSSYLNLNPP